MLDSRGMVFKTYISINNIYVSYKNWKQNLKTFNTTLILLVWRKVLFLRKKCWFFAKKNAEINKIKEVLVLKGTFSETTYKCVLTYQNSANSNKFQTRVEREGAILPLPFPITKFVPKKAIQIRVKTWFFDSLFFVSCFSTKFNGQRKKKSMLFWVLAICFSAPELSLSFCLSQLVQHNPYAIIVALTW